MKKDIQSLALVDLSHIFRAKWHASADQSANTAYEYTLKAAHKIADKDYDAVAFCLDTKPYHRSSLYAQYKGQREDDPARDEVFSRIKSELSSCGYHMWGDKGFEADDIIATAVLIAKAKSIPKVDIFTNDKDLFQLVEGDQVQVISTANGDRFGPQEVMDKMGVPPFLVSDMLALMGDSSDNIPGCKGIGEKTAARLVNELGGVENVVAMAEKNPVEMKGRGFKERQIQLIKDGRDVIMHSSTLVELMQNAKFPFDDIYKEKEVPSMDEDEVAMAVDEAAPPHIEPSQPPVETEGSPRFSVESKAKLEKMAPSLEKVVESAVVSKPRDHSAVVIDIGGGKSLTPATFDFMKQLAKVFHDSALYRRKYDSAQSVFAVMELGMELGLPLQVALQNFHVVEGKPTPAAHFLIALAKRDPDCEYLECVETTKEKCVYATKKKSYPEEMRLEFTIEDADREESLKPSRSGKKTAWQKMPDAMLRKTCGSRAARLWYPEACSGLYSLEEMGHGSGE